jgi:hypothetical protein
VIFNKNVQTGIFFKEIKQTVTIEQKEFSTNLQSAVELLSNTSYFNLVWPKILAKNRQHFPRIRLLKISANTEEK